ncbi:hypothetical protein TBLA_0A03380 [Henningerozyma blattae CBS 6284]|uniref:arginine--tRNA ligase n=1 Tax=Henningerozyma blattae (strain ATCC 34711 / CBS 6284 / DSM 70876 / NBRC 10599 / NRRL Y-10934 / UCD 77-7) TaxID=1071380 RepID=I2GVI6_HENB6|nr:hypothetical protein TBLA_0A03380 [Tetrapisispora blattae CBS 6284]CCH58138.1 hypothetical protein TBLA_0A03380 [Tetrapisispora blattae CBS 6284]
MIIFTKNAGFRYLQLTRIYKSYNRLILKTLTTYSLRRCLYTNKNRYNNSVLTTKKYELCCLHNKKNYSQNSKIKDNTSYARDEKDVFEKPKLFITNHIATQLGIDTSLVHDAIDIPKKTTLGDLILPLPKLRLIGTNYTELGKKLVNTIPSSKYIKTIVAHNAFIQIFLNPLYIYQTLLPKVLTEKENFGRYNEGKGKKVIIEFSSPNIAKPFHAGHLRSTIIGGFLSNLYDTMGWSVTKLNYLGDWGKQFGLLAVGFEKYGVKEDFLKDPINHLFEIYVKISQDIARENDLPDIHRKTDREAKQFFERMENGDEEALDIWRNFRSLSIDKYIETYSRLNIEYDSYCGESKVPKKTIEYVINRLKEDHLLKKKDGAMVVNLTTIEEDLGLAILQKSDKTSIYLSRDIGEALERYNKYKFDKMIYVVACQQDFYFRQLLATLKLMNFDWVNKLEHISFGMVKGMSTRKGKVVFLDTILNEAQEKMYAQMIKDQDKLKQIKNPKETADKVGISGVMIQDMQSKRATNYEFSWNRMLSFEGDTGPYLQYSHCRLKSIEDKNQVYMRNILTNLDFSLLDDKEAIELVRIMAQYPTVLSKALENSEPSTVVLYLFRLTHQISSCYKTLWVDNEEKRIAKARLALYSSARHILHNGLRILGITPIDRM